jgi:hypothetical protein
VNRWLRFIYPTEFARRHADEIAVLLKASRQPIRDHVNVVIHAIRLRSENVMSHLPRYLADVALAVALFLFGFLVNDLQSGLGEVPRHWWSSAAVLFVIVAGSARVAVAVIDRRRTNRPNTRTSGACLAPSPSVGRGPPESG